MALIVVIKVVPLSGEQKCIVDKAGRLKYCLKSPPGRGNANAELVRLLSKSLGCVQEKIIRI